MDERTPPPEDLQHLEKLRKEADASLGPDPASGSRNADSLERQAQGISPPPESPPDNQGEQPEAGKNPASHLKLVPSVKLPDYKGSMGLYQEARPTIRQRAMENEKREEEPQ